MNTYHTRELDSCGTDVEVRRIHLGIPQRLHTLDAVRGLAALVVVIHHCFLLQPAFSDYFLSNWQTQAATPFQRLLFDTPARLIWAGYEAVTLFFVLSGLVLALPWIEGHPPRYAAFCIKRVCRIYLPYCAIIGIAAVLNTLLCSSFFVAGGSHWVNDLTWSNPVTAWDLFKHALMFGHQFSINGAVHSLVWEMRVSLVFPLMMLPLVRWRAKGAAVMTLLLIGLTAGLEAPIRSLSRTRSFEDPVILTLWEFQHTAYFAVFFVLGATITLYLAQIRHVMTRAAPYYGGVICLLSGLLIVQAHWTQFRPAQQIMVGVGSALIIVAALAPGGIERVLSHRWLQFLGRISYSVYLVHIPLLLTFMMLLQRVLPLWAMLIIVPPVSIVTGWLFHETIAEPCARIGQRLTTQRRARPIATTEANQVKAAIR